MTDTFNRIATAKHGTDAQRQELINDEDWRVREAVAQYGTDAQRHELINDEDERVRAAANNG